MMSNVNIKSFASLGLIMHFRATCLRGVEKKTYDAKHNKTTIGW